MKQFKWIALGILMIFLTQCSSKKNNEIASKPKRALNTQLPKVLFITTGHNFNNEDKNLPNGIIVALHTFNKRGITVRLEPRDVLFKLDYLTQFNIIILSTAKGYHDGDRKYSLTYMTDTELVNLNEFVKSGGVIIAGENLGRNYFNGSDRILDSQELNPDNYPLANAFGVILKENNMRSYSISGDITPTLKGEFLPPSEEDLWTLIPERAISENIKVLATWRNGNDTLVPAITRNKFGKGMAYLLASSDFINPANSGGYWSVDQIHNFYNYVADEYFTTNAIKIRINPWPNAYKMAFCVTFNSTGEPRNYEYVLNRLNGLGIKPTFFVNGQIENNIREFLKSKNVNIASTGFHYLNYKNLSYPIALNDILLNEHTWDKKFKGYRFPYTNPDFTGLMAIDLHGYTYESSISVNNLEFMHGSVFPYNLVIAEDKFYRSTNILEIGPTYHDDYFFLDKLMNEGYKTPAQLIRDVMLYNQYLQNFWEYSVKPNNGLMVFIGHPGIVGFNDTTFSALENLITTVRTNNTWITNIEDVSEYRNKLEKIKFYVEDKGNKYLIYVDGPEKMSIADLTLILDEKPKQVKAKKGSVILNDEDEDINIVFEAFNGQVITITK